MVEAIENTDVLLFYAMGAIFIETQSVLDTLLDPEDESSPVDTKKMHAFFLSEDLGLKEHEIESYQHYLKSMWSIVDKRTALEAIQNLIFQGHRKKFALLKKNTSDLTRFKEIFKFDFADDEEITLSDQEFKKLATWIEGTHQYVPDVEILAWDLARLSYLLRLSYACQLITREELKQKTQESLPLIQQKFADWTEFSKSFLIGQTFWLGKESPELKAICEKLIEHRASPWQLL